MSIFEYTRVNASITEYVYKISRLYVLHKRREVNKI